jgi:C-terminal processing protease CtpA/Prc
MIFFAKKPKGFEVLRVAPDGPADKAGVKPQDVIVKINEKEASQMSIDEARAAINVAQYTLELQRPGGNVTLTVHAAQYASIVKALQH